MTGRTVLVLGGARSGKSAFSEQLASECGEPVVYVATARAVDQEMADRIARHRAQRPAAWCTVEAPIELAGQLPGTAKTVVVEDLTLLLSNHMERDIAAAELLTTAEIDRLLALGMNVILVSNEVGMGLVPEHPLGRQFRDALGRVNQYAARLCAEVYLLVAGLPLQLK